jgi:hypothetical protein
MTVASKRRRVARGPTTDVTARALAGSMTFTIADDASGVQPGVKRGGLTVPAARRKRVQSARREQMEVCE